MTLAEGRLLGAMVGWRMALPILKRVLPLPRLVGLVSGGTSDHAPAPADVGRIVTLAGRLFRPRLPHADNCLERSLLVFRFLLRAGVEPELVCGVEPNGGRVAGHAWVQLEGRPVTDPPEVVARFSPFVRFGPEGRR